MRKLIVTADDFGLSVEVNEAIETAHRQGILTAASLMVGAPAVQDAVERARRLPDLRVGLHLTLVESAPVLPPEQIPALVGRDGQLRTDMAALSLRLALDRRARRQLEAEIAAQFDAYARTGLALDHVDAHKHFHINPLVSGAVLRLGRMHDMRALRVPREPARVLRLVEASARAGHAAERLLAARLGAAAQGLGLGLADRVFGIAWSGAMHARRLAGLIAVLPEGTSEIFLHPATADVFAGSAPRYRYRDEFAALMDPAVIEAASRVELGAYGDLVSAPV